MEKIVYDAETIKIMSLFQSLTGALLKDCIQTKNQVIFIVQPGEIGKSIGKNAVNVKRLASRLKRKIKIVEFSEDVLTFTKNIIHPIKIKDIENTNETIIITPFDLKSRGYIIGKGGTNLRNIEQIVKRHFNIKELKIKNI